MRVFFIYKDCKIRLTCKGKWQYFIRCHLSLRSGFTILKLNHRSVWYYRPFFNHHNTILYSMGWVVAVRQQLAAVYDNVITYVGIFVDDCIFDLASVANTHNRLISLPALFNLLKGLIVVATHNVAVLDSSIKPDTGTYADY